MTTDTNVTFLQDHQSYHSGHEFYPAGAKATLTGGRALVDMGVAREGWGPPPRVEQPPKPEPEPNKKVPALELRKVQMYDLRQMGKAKGVKGYSKMRKADLIAALLEDVD